MTPARESALEAAEAERLWLPPAQTRRLSPSIALMFRLSVAQSDPVPVVRPLTDDTRP